jgi:L-lysine 6-transaminase
MHAREILGRWIQADGMDLVCDLEGSRGHYLRDQQSGEEYLDFFCFFAARPLAYNHPKLSDPALIERMGKVARHKPANCDVYTPEYADFVDTFCRVALGGAFEHAFFIEGGSVAVENAMKAAIDWKHRKNIQAGRGEKGSQILHFKEAFHGRTGYSLSVTDPFDSRKIQFFPKFDWPRVTNPKMTFPQDQQAIEAVEALEAKAIGEIHKHLDAHPDDIAAILVEPIQGEGGDNYFRSAFIHQLREIADEREVMLIFDEVQTGMGSTGKWWDWMNHGVKPDLMVFGKKTSVCGFASTGRVDEVEGVFRVGSRISSTFEGNLVDMMRCQRLVEIMAEDHLVDNARNMGLVLQTTLSNVQSAFPEINNLRGRGLWAAFDLPSTERRNALLNACFKNKLLVIPCGQRSLRLRPSLDITSEAIEEAGRLLRESMQSL